MPLQLKQHIQLQGDNPLDAIVDGHVRIKAYLVASLAIQDGVDAALEQYKDYNLSVAAVHAALSFHYENEAAIQKAKEEAREQIRVMGGFDRIDEIRRRCNEKTKKENDN